MNTRIPEVFFILAALLAAVSLATLTGYLLKLRRPADPAIVDLNIRIRSWWPLILISGGALLAGPIAVTLLFGAISLLALREFFQDNRRAFYFCGWIAVPVQYWLAADGPFEAFALGIPLAGALLADSANTLIGVLLCVYSVSHIPALMSLHIPGYERRTPILMVFVVLIAQLSDILQYIWGKLLGKHTVVPSISPSKTVEGLVGGVLTASLLGAMLYPLTPFQFWQSGLMALIISILGFLGGLITSTLKRGRGIKDWGSLIRGHGGILDRIDSLCLSAPVFFHLTRHFFT